MTAVTHIHVCNANLSCINLHIIIKIITILLLLLSYGCLLTTFTPLFKALDVLTCKVDFFAQLNNFYSAERCISYDRFCLTVRPSDRLSVTLWYHAKTIPPTIMRSSLEDSPMTLVSWRLTSARNSKGNIGSEGAE